MAFLPPPRPFPGVAPTRGGWLYGNPALNLTTGEEKIVPRIYGRALVTPVLAWSGVKTPYNDPALWYSYRNLTSDLVGYADSIDAVLVLGQAPLTIQGVRKNGEVVGLALAEMSPGSKVYTWQTQNPGTSIQRAIGRLGQVRYTSVWVPGGNLSTSGGYENTFAECSNFEAILAASTPWGFKADSTDPANFPSVTGGSESTPPAWGYLTGSADAGIAFAGLAHIRFERLALTPGSATQLPSIKFVVDGIATYDSGTHTYGTGPDCLPSVAIRDVLVNMLGIPDANVITNVGSDGNAASSVEYYEANNSDIRLNCAVTGTAKEVLDDLLVACNCDLVYSNGNYRVLPLGDRTNGTYIPATVAFTVGTSDILGDTPLEVEIADEGQVFNAAPVTYQDASANFESRTYTHRNDFDIAVHGLKQASAISSQWISNVNHACAVSQLLVNRSLNNRRTLRFKLGARYAALERGDVLSVSDVSIPSITCQITKIEENDDFSLSIEAVEWTGAVDHRPLVPEAPAPPPNLIPPTVLADAKGATDTQAAWVSDVGTGTDGKTAKDLSDADAGAVKDKLISDCGLTNYLPFWAFCHFEFTGSGIALDEATGTSSISRVDRGVGTSPRYVVRVAWSNAMASGYFWDLVTMAAQHDLNYWGNACWCSDTSTYARSDIGIRNLSDQWVDPNSVGDGLSVLVCRIKLF